MNISDMTRKQFEALPFRKWDEDIGTFDSLIILPLRRLHDSGYRCMDFIAVRGGEPIARLSGCSDVIHIDGVGGMGKNWNIKGNEVPAKVAPRGWMVDCLKRSGLLRLFLFNRISKLSAGPALSSFDLYAED